MTLVAELAGALPTGDRRALAKAITLVESLRPEDRAPAHQLLSLLAPTAGRSFRVGVTGVPGAGKSTLIDALGLVALAAGRRVAVLAVDPSSRRSGGSVLGDKTRMTRLATEANAFVRPSPTLGVLGGTAAHTREVILLCEAAGYDLVLVETVGVGQSEEQVASMVDCLLLVALAGAGDELSSMKRGLLEAADLITFNKADGERASAVANEAAALRSSLGISRGAHTPPVAIVSALEGAGVPELWAALAAQQAEATQSGAFAQRRSAQRIAWFGAALEEALQHALSTRSDLLSARASAEREVEAGALAPWQAADCLLAQLLPQTRE